MACLLSTVVSRGQRRWGFTFFVRSYATTELATPIGGASSNNQSGAAGILGRFLSWGGEAPFTGRATGSGKAVVRYRSFRHLSSIMCHVPCPTARGRTLLASHRLQPQFN